MKYFKGTFNDRITKAAGIIFVLIWIVVLFGNYSSIPESHPLLGSMIFLLVPLLFIGGGITFIIAILKFMK